MVLKPPEFIYKDRKLEEFEKKKEELQKEKEILQMKVEIAKLRSELKKYALSDLPQPQRPEKNSYKEQYEMIKLQQQELQDLEARLSKIQTLFTGVMEVGKSKVAFDSYGRKYSPGSVIYGMRIVDIRNDGIIVTRGQRLFKIPIASGSLPSKDTGSGYNISSPPPASSPQHNLPETPPIPAR